MPVTETIEADLTSNWTGLHYVMEFVENYERNVNLGKLMLTECITLKKQEFLQV